MKNSTNKRTSLEEKIKIFERFKQTGEELTGNTVFEEYPIGKWTIQIRNLMKNNRINPSKEQLKTLEDMGILKRGIDSTTDEKIQELVEWMKKYPKAKLSRQISEDKLKQYISTPEEHKKIIEEYKTMIKYYKYIIRRLGCDKLSEEQILTCKEGHVGGVFGYSTQVEELAKKYGQTQSDMEYIVINFGTIDKFIHLYRNGKLNKDDFLMADSIIKKLLDIDFCANSNRYDKLCYAILDKKISENGLVLYSSEKIDEALQTLSLRQRIVIEEKFALIPRTMPKDLATIAKEFNISRERARQIESKAIRKLRQHSKKIFYSSTDIENSDLLPEDEKNQIRNLIQKISKSNILFNKDLSQKDIDDEEILNGIKFIKEIDDRKIKRKQEQQQEQERKTEETKDIKIEELNLSNRTYNCLKRMQINTIGDLTELTQKELLSKKNLGKKCAEDVFVKLQNNFGICLKKDKKNPKIEIDEPVTLENAKKRKTELEEKINKIKNDLKKAEELLAFYNRQLSNKTPNSEEQDFKED